MSDTPADPAYPAYWHPLADAICDYLLDSPASTTIDRIRVWLAEPGYIERYAEHILRTWRNTGTHEQADRACRMWVDLRHSIARVALAESVRQRFAKES